MADMKGTAYLTSGGTDPLVQYRRVGLVLSGLPLKFSELNMQDLANAIGESIAEMNGLLQKWSESDAETKRVAVEEAVSGLAETPTP